MLAFILAAGFATRLRPYSERLPKALMEIEPGVSLIEYIIDSIKRSGVKEIYVLTREELYDILKERVKNQAHVTMVNIQPGDGNLWTISEGIKALKGEIWEDILLIMSDHIFEVSMIKRVLDYHYKVSHGRSVLMCLDRAPRGRYIIEGLKIEIEGRKVSLAGKSLLPTAGVDTGIFIIPRKFIKHILDIAEEKGRSASLADFVNALASKESVEVVDVTGYLWHDIDTAEDLTEARLLYWDILKRNLVKETDGPVAKTINRKISTRISTFLYRNRIFIDPNILSIILTIAGLATAILIFLKHAILGGVLAEFVSIMDGVDGELARLYKRESELGAFLDSLLDRIVDISLIIATTSLLFNFMNFVHLLLLLSIAISGALMVSYTNSLLRKAPYLPKLRNSFPWATRDVRLLTLAIGLVISMPEAIMLALIYIAISSWAYVIRAVYYRISGPKEHKAEDFLRTGRPLPQVEVPRTIIRYHAGNIASSTVYLLVAILVLGGLKELFTYLKAPTPVLSAVILTQILVISYFGVKIIYNILRLSHVLVTTVTKARLTTPSVFWKITTFSAAAVAIGVIWLIARTAIEPLIYSTEALRALDLFFVALIILTIYQLGKIVYRAFEHKIHQE